MMKKILFAVVAGIGLLSFTGCSQNLDGSYSNKENFFLAEATDSLKFEGDNVIHTDPDGKTEKGTYEISDGKLEMKIDGHTVVAELSKDKKTFKIKNAGGLLTMLNKIEYAKDEG